MAREFLSLNRDDFRLDSGLERRLHELARKHCGNQDRWTISMELLHKKNGPTACLKKFRRKVKMIVQSDLLADYRLRYQPEAGQALSCTKDPKRLAESFGPSPPLRSIEHLSLVHQIPMLRSIRPRGRRIRLVFPRLYRLISTPQHARDLNSRSNVLTPNPSPE